MKRTVKRKDLPQWKKVGGGTFRMGNGRIIKSGQVFRAAAEDIPVAFRDLVKAVDGITQPTGGKAKSVKKSKDKTADFTKGGYTLKTTDDKHLFDVIDPDGKVVTEEPVSEVDAQDIIESLTIGE